MNEDLLRIIELLASISIDECWTDKPCEECKLNQTASNLASDSIDVTPSVCGRIGELAEIIQDLREGGKI